jgi:hypothetical protein
LIRINVRIEQAPTICMWNKPIQPAMKPFLNVRRTRYAAIAMLFVWLMTLGIGVANACLTSAAHEHYGMAASAVAAHEAAEEHDKSSDGHLCLSFCAAAQSTLVKVKPQTVDLTGFDFTPVPLCIATVVLAPDRNPWRSGRSEPIWLEPAISIRFLRLTI